MLQLLLMVNCPSRAPNWSDPVAKKLLSTECHSSGPNVTNHLINNFKSNYFQGPKARFSTTKTRFKPWNAHGTPMLSALQWESKKEATWLIHPLNKPKLKPLSKLQSIWVFTVISVSIKSLFKYCLVIIDWHDHNAHYHTDKAVAFFSAISKKYAGNPHIIYEIYNEPLQVPWTDLKPYHTAVNFLIQNFKIFLY